MDPLSLLIVLIIVGAVLYVVPMDAQIKNLIVVVVIVVVAILLLRALFGGGLNLRLR